MDHHPFIEKHLSEILYRFLEKRNIMSSNLSSYFRFSGQKMSPDQVQTKDMNAATVKPGSGLSNQSLTEIRQLIAGQTISGEIVTIKGNEVEILLDKGGYLTARLESDLNLTPGKMLSFEVKQNLGSQLILRPLFENLEQYPNVNKAIEAAGIPQNDRTAELVKELMRQGMPVDKNTLQNMHKIMLHFPNAEPADLVQMTKLNLPVTSDSIGQFEQYKNLEHSVLRNVMDIAEDFSKIFSNEIQTQTTSPEDLFQKLSVVFTQNADVDLLTDQKLQNALAGPEVRMSEMMEKTDLFSNIETDKQNPNLILDQDLLKAVDTNSKDQLIQQTSKSYDLQQDLTKTYDLEDTIKQIISGKISPESLPVLLDSKELNPYQLFRLTQEILADNTLLVHEEWKEFVKSGEFQNILKEALLSQWLIEPDQIAQEGKISNLYETMHAQTVKISQMLAAMDEKYSPLLKQVNSLTQNVEFMNHLNQIFQYVQLPIKLANETAHGELYVYSKKKNLSGHDDSISAFLHLDMEHLGKVDVYVTLKGEKVSTNFKLEDEACLKLIEDHLSILDEHLKKRGYQMHADLSIADKEVNLIEEMIAQEKGVSLLSEFSFDVRA